jgi:Dyp-type peroxidase family
MWSRGVLPNEVIKDPRAEAMLVAMDLRPELTRDQAKEWLGQLSLMISRLAAPAQGQAVASVAVGFGRSFFTGPDGAARFELQDRMPAGLPAVPDVSVVEPMPATDLMLYMMVTTEAAAAEFLRKLSATRSSIAKIAIDRGFQRDDRRELFGFLDGLRNAPYPHRYGVTFVDREESAPDEPDWTEDGTYLAYLKIHQDLDLFGALPPEEQERIIGRRRADGSRTDLPEGTEPTDEPEFSSDAPVINSHVRKAGPRGDDRDEVQIFRRGVPYLTLDADGTTDAGLHFVSFQARLVQFETVLSTWMLHPDFPAAGVGPDDLFRSGHATVQRAGFYFVPPYDARFLGARMFDEPRAPARPRNVGRVIVRKRAEKPDGTKAFVDLAGCVFQVLDEARQPIGESFRTDSAGHTISGDLPVRVPLILTEMQVPTHLEIVSPEIPFQIDERREMLVVTNRLLESGYGG